MLLRIPVFGAAGCVLVGALAAQPSPRQASIAAPVQQTGARAERHVPFKAGETLGYDVSWSTFLTAGTATVSVREKRPSFASVAWYIVAEGQPTPLVSRLYTVYYKADTLLDAYTLLTQRASVFSQEGGRRRMKATRFDQVAHTARFEVTTATVVTRDFPVPPDAQDALSAIYVIRSLPLRQGFTTTIPVVDGDDVYRVEVSVTGHESVTTPAGEFPAWRITPTVLDDRSGTHAKGLVIWVSDDGRRLPLRMEAEMPFGRFVLTLREARG
jgi:hypothetical protein